jgi:hypothetical protein
MMLWFIDSWIERLFKTALHKRREPIINRALKNYEYEHPAASTDLLKIKMGDETDRIYAIIDRSILRERLVRARYTFWVTAITGTGVVLAGSAFGVVSLSSSFPFITPSVLAFVAWAVSVGTLPIAYNQRVKGAMDAVIIAHDKSLVTFPATLIPQTIPLHSLTTSADTLHVDSEQQEVLIEIDNIAITDDHVKQQQNIAADLLLANSLFSAQPISVVINKETIKASKPATSYKPQ